jgi:hypothetical protein
MATLKREPSVEMLSTFDMTKIIWTLKKNSWAKRPKFIISRKKKTSHIAKTFLQVSKGCRIINVARNFYLNPHMEEHHFNMLIQK